MGYYYNLVKEGCDPLIFQWGTCLMKDNSDNSWMKEFIGDTLVGLPSPPFR